MKATKLNTPFTNLAYSISKQGVMSIYNGTRKIGEAVRRCVEAKTECMESCGHCSDSTAS